MAAIKKRQASYPQAEFEIPLVDAVADLIHPQEREPTDSWHFQVEGETLRITRLRAPVEDPIVPPNAAPQANQAIAKKATRIR